MIANSPGYTVNFPNRDMWRKIADELNGEFKIKFNSGHELEIHEITIPYKKRIIKITVSDSRPLKFQVLFNSSLDFWFNISREDFIDRIIQKFSKSVIKMGWKEFDNHYLVKSNRSDLVKNVITKKIQNILLKYNVYSISYNTELNKNNSTLLGVIQRIAGKKEMIFELIDMYKLLIDNLEKFRIVK